MKGKNGSKSSIRPYKRDNCLNIFVIYLSYFYRIDIHIRLAFMYMCSICILKSRYVTFWCCVSACVSTYACALLVFLTIATHFLHNFYWFSLTKTKYHFPFSLRSHCFALRSYAFALSSFSFCESHLIHTHAPLKHKILSWNKNDTKHICPIIQFIILFWVFEKKMGRRYNIYSMMIHYSFEFFCLVCFT